ncbi:MAG: hypothetical protein PHN81_00100 [Actinomycetota bacterium]|nr:hypothetical protein [Actinomycetota bacterium]
MNVFNKIIVVLLLIFLICVSITSLVNIFVGYFKWSDLALKVLNPEYSMNKLTAALLLTVVLIISLFLLLLEFYKKRIKIVNISSSKTGSAMVTLEAIGGQIKNEVLSVEGVEDLSVKIVPGKTGIIINMNTTLNENVDVTGKVQEIISKASSVASDRLGLKVLKTNLTVAGLVAGGKEVESKEKNELSINSREIEQEPGETTGETGNSTGEEKIK